MTHDAELLKEILLDINKEVGKASADISAIKTDLREHMRRTAILETEIKWLHRQVWIAHGAILFLGFLGALIALLKNIKYF